MAASRHRKKKVKKSNWDWEWELLASMLVYPCALKRGVIKKSGKKTLLFRGVWPVNSISPPVTPTQSTQYSSEYVQQLLLSVFFYYFFFILVFLHTITLCTKYLFPFAAESEAMQFFLAGRKMREVWRVDCTTGWAYKKGEKFGAIKGQDSWKKSMQRIGLHAREICKRIGWPTD